VKPLFKIINYYIVMISLLVASNLYADKFPYPIIFVHGLTGSDETFYETMDFMRTQYKIGPVYVFDMILNADNSKSKAKLEDDIKWENWTYEETIIRVGRRTFAENIDDYVYAWSEQTQLFTINFKEERIKGASGTPNDFFDQSNQAAIYKQGFALSIMIKEVLQFTGSDKVILVGHSMGGLAIREYLQRIEDNNRRWWIDSSKSGHKVARVVTIGTPHLGSNAACDPTKKRSGYPDFNGTSEAMRDLTYEYDSFSNCSISNKAGIYLFGGNEECISGIFKFNNADINCNGQENDIIYGINQSTAFNPQMPLPDDLLYTWIVSDVNKGENPTCLYDMAWFCSGSCKDGEEPSGDGSVLLERQYLYINGKSAPIGNSYTLLIHTDHDNEGNDYEAIIRGLDEPESFTLAYEINNNQSIIGLISSCKEYNVTDIDTFKIKNLDELLVVNIKADLNTGAYGIEIFDENGNKLTSAFRTQNEYLYRVSTPVSVTGYSFIKVWGWSGNETWKYPYTLFAHFDRVYRNITANFSTDNRFGESPFSVKFIDESETENTNITKWLWDFGDESTSNEANPVHVYTKGGVYTVTLTVKDDYGNLDIKKIYNYILVSNTNSELNIVEIEYFFDKDPGLGKGKPTQITPDKDVIAQVHIDVSGLTQGFHQLYVRAKDESGTWGLAQSRPFLIQLPNTGVEKNKITSVEYFFDKDPDIGNGNLLSISSGENITAETLINVSGLAQGFHRLYVRAQDETGTWGLAQSKPFLIQTPNKNESQSNNISSIEYFFDQDPNIGNGNSLSISSSEQVTVQTLINVSGLTQGFHRLYVRAQNETGTWGLAQSRPFLIQTPNKSEPEPNNISSIEYFFDKDPNIGKGETLAITPAENVIAQTSINVSDLTQGFHRLYVRAQDETGTWGLAQSRPFLIQESSDSEYNKNQITSIEYFFDKDPGIGAGNTIEIITPGRIVEIEDVMQIDDLLPGVHKLYVRAKDNKNQWGLTQCNEFVVETNYSIDILQKIITSLKIISGINIKDKNDNEIVDIKYIISLFQQYFKKE